MPRPLRVLIVDDSPTDAELLVRELRRAGFAPEWVRVETEADYLASLRPELDVILSDDSLPEFGGLRALELLHERGLAIPFILVSGTIGEESAVAAMKQGAADYLLKDRLGRLGRAVGQAVEKGILHRERRQGEAALRESEERFRQLAENIQDVFWLTDLTTNRMLYVSPAYEEIWGRSRANLSASPRKWLDAIHPEDRELVFGSATASQPGGIYDKEYRIVRPDGSIRWIRDRAFPVANATGEVDRVAGVARDITEQKRADSRIREQAAMLDQAHDAIIVHGFDGRSISFWNKGAENLYGWTAAEATGRNIGDLLFADASRLDVIAEQLLKTDEWAGENRHLSKGGKELTVSTRATLLRDASGKPVSVLAINSDITEQKKMEAQLLQAQRLEGIGTLAGGLAHDLNNILAPILMSVPILEQALAGTHFVPIVSTIGECAERGAGIVRQVLTFARGVEGERIFVQMHYLLSEMGKIADETFPRSITIRNLVPHALWPVNGDATQLQQVLLNLCINARDAMPTGGTLTLDARNLEIDENYAAMSPGSKPGPYLMLSISDTGHGIPAEIMGKIFDPFFTTKEVGKGTGLGLSSVIGIVKSHHGFLSVESQPGKGSTFKIFLPAEPEAAAMPETAREEPLPPGDGELILLVDDEPGIRSVAKAVLQGHGYRVLLAADGTEALAVFAQNSAELAAVVTDIAMPFMDGALLIRALRRMKPDIRVIVSTGNGEKALVSDLHANAFLRKPYDAGTLLRALHTTLAGRHEALSP